MVQRKYVYILVRWKDKIKITRILEICNVKKLHERNCGNAPLCWGVIAEYVLGCFFFFRVTEFQVTREDKFLEHFHRPKSVLGRKRYSSV